MPSAQPNKKPQNVKAKRKSPMPLALCTLWLFPACTPPARWVLLLLLLLEEREISSSRDTPVRD